jgi:hypothetical protein
MSSKARFAKDSKQGKTASGGSGPIIFDTVPHYTLGSKKGNQTTTGIGVKPGQIQVIFNGKIATPQSLLPRKTATHNFTTKRMTSRLTATEADEPQHAPILPGPIIEEKEEPKNLSKKLSSHTSMRKYLFLLGLPDIL